MLEVAGLVGRLVAVARKVVVILTECLIGVENTTCNNRDND